MCGIFGFVSQPARTPELVIEGLRHLEYRGYDSWGLASVHADREMIVARQTGKISKITDDPWPGRVEHATAVIGHTRWATHGPATVANAHPHLSPDGRIAVVHNGIIENHRELRNLLEAEGYCFHSQTDTEVIAYLFSRELERTDDFGEAFTRALLQLQGAFGLAVVDNQQPDRLFVVRLGSPLVIGLADGIRLISSDVNALLPMTNNVVYLDDGEWAEISATQLSAYDFHRAASSKMAQELQIEQSARELGDFEHFMLKEIHDQPKAIRDAISGRLKFREATLQLAGLAGLGELNQPRRVKILACGSSWHAGLVGKHYLEELAGLPTDVEHASEFRYRNAVLDPDTLVIAISQSGETADTLAALRESKRRGALALGIVNVVGSTIARECGRGIYLHAGPEFGVAATKSFTNQLVVLLQLAIFFGRKRGMPIRMGLELLQALQELPDLTAAALEQGEYIGQIAREYADARNFFYVGRSMEYPIAMEGALKLKEVSYIHAEGLPAAELKHGPIALISPEVPTVVLATQSFFQSKIASNVQEIKARGGRIIAVVTEGNEQFEALADHVITVPKAHDMISPILATIPVQFLAYHLALLNGCDVDQPRNLAKCVTVE